MDKPDLQGVAPSRRASIRRKRSDAVADLIRSHIIQPGQQPIDRLPHESELIEMFGCSRSTQIARGAGARAEQTGGGARVAPVSINRIVGLLSNYFYLSASRKFIRSADCASYLAVAAY